MILQTSRPGEKKSLHVTSRPNIKHSFIIKEDKILFFFLVQENVTEVPSAFQSPILSIYIYEKRGSAGKRRHSREKERGVGEKED